jgi:hypothetical protein
MMRSIDNPPRCRKGFNGLCEERRSEPHHTRIHTEECNAEHP